MFNNIDDQFSERIVSGVLTKDATYGQLKLSNQWSSSIGIDWAFGLAIGFWK